MTMEQAVEALNDSWSQNHAARVQAWDQQVLDDAAALAALNQQEDNPAPPVPAPEQEQEKAEAEKKKSKMKDFDDNTTVGNYIAPRPAQYALRRVEDFEYAELWYFTPEGCTDATQQQLTQHDEAFGLTRVEDMVAFKSVSSLKASKNAVPDADLSFRQMSMAKNALIPLMTKYQWPAKAIMAFAQLFTQLELHPFRQREYGERALITYQARVRREWHDQLKLGSAFNVERMNEDLLQSIYRELLDKAQLLSLKEVSSFFSLSSPHLVLTFFLLSFPPPFVVLPRSLRHAPTPCTNAPCTMHHAPCTMHHAPPVVPALL
jgi:hypothetical protein